jgi:hypothetical protein
MKFEPHERLLYFRREFVRRAASAAYCSPLTAHFLLQSAFLRMKVGTSRSSERVGVPGRVGRSGSGV